MNQLQSLQRIPNKGILKHNQQTKRESMTDEKDGIQPQKPSIRQGPLTPEFMEHMGNLLVKALKEGLQKQIEQEKARKLEMDQGKDPS